jgi:hypothetical protein
LQGFSGGKDKEKYIYFSVHRKKFSRKFTIIGVKRVKLLAIGTKF